MALTTFDWHEIWPEGTSSSGWSHSGIAVTEAGRVVFCAPGGRSLVLVDPTGDVSTVETALTEIHGISLDPGRPGRLWLADPGVKPDPAHEYQQVRHPGRVLSVLEDGSDPIAIADPDEGWRPTSVVADRNGDVWVADGYGRSLVHKFSVSGQLLLTLDGSDTGLRFDCPHGIAVAGASDVLMIADRGNSRVLGYSLDGKLMQTLTSPLIRLPSCLAVRGDAMVVTELGGGLLSISAEGDVSELVEHSENDTSAPWPNALVDGRLARPHLDTRRLNSPHGVAVDRAGSIYLTEWMIGGRQLRLTPAG